MTGTHEAVHLSDIMRDSLSLIRPLLLPHFKDWLISVTTWC